MTTAFWDGNVLFISWYGSEAEEAAYWRNGRLLFDGVSETFNRGYVVKPDARVALNDILRWQGG